MSELQKMFDYQGKTTKVIGTNRAKAYQEIYNYISDLQESKTIKTHENYLNDNELAQNIYAKKYFLIALFY